MAFSEEEIAEELLEATSRGGPEKLDLKGFGLLTPAELRREENKAYRQLATSKLRRRAWSRERYAADPEFRAAVNARASKYAKTPNGRKQSRKRRKEKWAMSPEDIKEIQRAKWRQYQALYRASRPAKRETEAAKRKAKAAEAQLLKYLKLYLTFNPDEAKRQHVVALLQLFNP